MSSFAKRLMDCLGVGNGPMDACSKLEGEQVLREEKR
jgi:hypothetical protein